MPDLLERRQRRFEMKETFFWDVEVIEILLDLEDDFCRTCERSTHTSSARKFSKLIEVPQLSSC